MASCGIGGMWIGYERGMVELDVDCLLFFPVEGTGSNPEWGDYSVVACCCVCMHMAVFGGTFGEVMVWLSPP